MNLPNKLTMVRLYAIPLLIIISLIKPLQEIIVFLSVTLEDLLLLIVFSLASFTDFLDGHIARKRNIVTNFGKFMDPLADKMLVFATLLILLERGRLVVFGVSLAFTVTLILAREFAIMGIRVIAASNNVVIAASKLGKLKTVSQMLMIIVLLFIGQEVSWVGAVTKDVIALVLIVFATIMTLVSGADYLIKNKNVLRENLDN